MHLTSVGFVLVLHLYSVEGGLTLQLQSSILGVVRKKKLEELTTLMIRKVKEKKWAFNIIFGS
jgi:hypothetical protein